MSQSFHIASLSFIETGEGLGGCGRQDWLGLFNKPGGKQCFRSAGWVLRAHCVLFQGNSFQSQPSVRFPSYYTCLDAGDLEKNEG